MADADYGLGTDVRFRDAVNDAWNDAKSHWWRLRTELRKLGDAEAATALTRDTWLMPLLEILGFSDVEALASSIGVGGTDYPISHLCGATPIHLMGAGVELDARSAGVRGAARLSPHSLVQQFLNRSDDHLWGIVTNGLRLRILRDSVSLTRQAYVDFDLEAMFNGEVFADFIVLYRVAHASRFAGEPPEDCFLERWVAAARDDGIRALDRLRDGVESALSTLGSGFLNHRDNDSLRTAVAAGELDSKQLYRYLLRLVYRLLFLFVAEDRDLLLVPDADVDTRARYERYYSTGRLRELAGGPAGSGHADLWAGLVALMRVLGRDEGEPRLGLPGLGSFLWAEDSIGSLINCDLDNADLLTALRGLAHVEDEGTLRRIDFGALGAEEFGSVYESLLELHPEILGDGSGFALGGGAGSERKTTGSYYTPRELISELLDSALDPVLDQAATAEDPVSAILNLKVVDPAAGSGHFLVAAAHRIGKRLAEARTGEPEPPEEAYRTAIRDVTARCLFAVDINVLAVELCKVSLWIETLEPGKPLSFLDHHILVGNSLVGATPSAIAAGIPDDAFVALTGDDKKFVAGLKRRNRRERSGQDALGFNGDSVATLRSSMEALEKLADTDLGTVRAKERTLTEWKQSPIYEHARLVADALCAAYAIEKVVGAPELTDRAFRRIRDEGYIEDALRSRVASLAHQYQFFHWHLAFPQVFEPGDVSVHPGWSGGFDVVLGNPPWERVKLQEKEFFAARSPDIAAAPNKAARQQLISSLARNRPFLWGEFRHALRNADVSSHYARASGVFPFCGRGDVNTYALFAELSFAIASEQSRIGAVLPLGIVSDFTTRLFFEMLVESARLVSVFGFENEELVFPGIHHAYRFCLLTFSGQAGVCLEPEFAFFLRHTRQIMDEQRRFCLSAVEIRQINPNTRTAPVFRSRRDADLVSRLHRQWPILWSEEDNEWGVKLATLFHMSGDSSSFVALDGLEGLEEASDTWPVVSLRGEGLVPVYEAKMFHHYDHRFGTYEGQTEAQRRQGKLPELSDADHADPSREVMPRYWVQESSLKARLGASANVEWFPAWRNITGATNARTLILTVLPAWAVGHSAPIIFSEELGLLPGLVAYLSSYISDYVARQKLAGVNFTFQFLRQLPVPPPDVFQKPCTFHEGNTWLDFVTPRVVELVATSWSMASFAEAFVGHGGPFLWQPARRQLLRDELDATCLVLAGIDRTEAIHVLDTFRVVRQREIAQHGRYRSMESILTIYDRMLKSAETGEPYRTNLDPPPADTSLRFDVQTRE